MKLYKKVIYNSLIWGSVIAIEYFLYMRNYSETRILILIPLLLGFIISDLVLLNKEK